MQDDPTEKEVPELMTIPEIAKRSGLSRQRVHRIAQIDPDFPAPVMQPGTTRPKYPRSAVDTYFSTRVLRPGRRTDLEEQREQSDEED